MKRITERDRYGKAILTNWGSVEDMVEKLADYEDLGLEPAEISEMMNSTAQLLSERGRIDKFLPGQTVYAIERDEWGDACDVSGYMYLASSGNEAILSVFINDLDNLCETLEYHVINTRENYDTNLCAFPLLDCFETYEEADAAMRRECGNVYEET